MTLLTPCSFSINYHFCSPTVSLAFLLLIFLPCFPVFCFSLSPFSSHLVPYLYHPSASQKAPILHQRTDCPASNPSDILHSLLSSSCPSRHSVASSSPVLLTRIHACPWPPDLIVGLCCTLPQDLCSYYVSTLTLMAILVPSIV